MLNIGSFTNSHWKEFNAEHSRFHYMEHLRICFETVRFPVELGVDLVNIQGVMPNVCQDIARVHRFWEISYKRQQQIHFTHFGKILTNVNEKYSNLPARSSRHVSPWLSQQEKVWCQSFTVTCLENIEKHGYRNKAQRSLTSPNICFSKPCPAIGPGV